MTSLRQSLQRPQGRSLPVLADCHSCGTHKTCRTPKMAPVGKGGRQVLILGDRPGKAEDQQGKPFVGPSGRYLADVVRKVGFDLKEDCVVSNAIICYSDRDNIDKEVTCCQPNVVDLVQRLKPHVIIPAGQQAVKSLIGWLWKDNVGDIGRWVGFQIPCQKINAWICPTWNPAHLLRSRDKNGGKIDPILERLFEQHLANAFALEDRPWNKVPDYVKTVELIYTPDDAEIAIRSFQDSGNPVAFDYECLVPSTKVLTSDFRWISIGNLSVGNELIGFEEVASYKSGIRKLMKTKVTATKRFKAPCLRITFEDGRSVVASTNHPWLARMYDGGVVSWTRSDDLRPGMWIRQITDRIWESDQSRDGGWLAGFFDGEGYVTNKVTVGFAQVEGPLFTLAMSLIKKFGFTFGQSEKKANTFNTNTRQKQMIGYCKNLQDTMHFLGVIRPSRLIANLQRNIFSNQAALPRARPYATISKIESVGDQEVVGLTTDTKTYVAEGLCSHNTDRLKPDSKDARIFCCSVSDGKRTIAYPWLGKAITATSELLLSDVPKYGWNIRFEDNWTRRVLGHGVNNWRWDGMINAHLIDNRSNITSLKFQSFVEFGIDAYDTEVGPYLKGNGSNVPNRIFQAPIAAVLRYCGIDSLMEFKCCRKQMRDLNMG